MGGARRIMMAGVAACIALSGIAVLPPGPTPTGAVDEPAVFDPLASAQSQGPAVFGHVATDGEGNFYAVHRVATPIGQYIAVRKSVDGGRSWVTVQMLQGTAGGGTRPQLSVWESYVAVSFVGAWCDPATPGVCGEAPYLAVSENGGATWSGPRRLDRQAFDMHVAQDSDRTWVAWERGGSMELRMTTDGGATWAITRQIDRAVTGQLAAGDGAAILTYFVNPVTPDDDPSTWALVADLDTLATTATPVDPGLDWEVAYPIAAAAAGGRVHVVTRTSMKNTTDRSQRIVQVHSADTDGFFGDQVSLDLDGWSASIAAQRGTVALAVGDRNGVTSVATSTDQGATFSDPVPVTTSTDGNAPIVGLGLARLPVDKPVARYTWSVPDRYVDEDGDGFLDPANDTNYPSADAIRVWARRTMTVTVDACSSVAPDDRRIVAYKWTELLEGGGTNVLPLTGCTGEFEFEDGEQMTLRLDVTDSAGQRSSAVQTVQPRDYVVASLGDSVASGEGNPHVDASFGVPAIWQDRACHRSVGAGPSIAAARLEDADPHSSVTFIQLACSGAAVLDSPEVPGTDDEATGGVIDQYRGQEPQPDSLRPSQVSQLQEMLGLRTVDAMLLSIGANDVRFSDTLTACIKEPRCDTTTTRTEFEQRITTLPSRYSRLDAALDDIGVDPAAVHITEYFDPSVDERGVTQMRCAISDGVVELLDDDEARWASIGVTGAINSAVAAAAGAHGWNLVGGLANAFRGHGYCSTDPWIVRFGESLVRQGNKDGSFHPNALGHSAYADAIYRSLRSDLLVPPPAQPRDPAAGAPALGDIMVLSATTNAITVTALRDTGGAPAIIGSRLIDRVVSGPGGLGISGPPAVSRTAAVGSWTQLPTLGTTSTEQQLAQLAVKPNVAVLTVEVMQAPRNEQMLVTERDTVVVAILDATIEQPTTVTVDVQASVLPADPDDPASPPGRPLVSTSESVQLVPGLNRVILPTDEAFTLGAGEVPTATVVVHDPEGADPADDLDNELTTDPNRPKVAVETRPLVVQMMTSPTPDLDVVPCASLADITRKQTAFAREVLPVAQPGFLVMLSCTEFPPFLDSSEDALVAYINMLDMLARQSQVDIMASVVPDGWLQGIAKGAVGVAVPGRRGVIIEASAPKMVLAHEIAHSFGVDHVAGTPTVTGVDVTRRALVTGVDYMAERTPERSWTGPATWDSLITRIGPPGGVPAPPAPLGDEFEFGGTVGTDGTFDAADPVRGDTGSPRPTTSGANLTRMVLEQTTGGVVADSQPVPLEEIGGMFAPGSGPTGPIGWSYLVRTSLLPGVDGVQFRLDGEVVQQYELTAPPEVTVTSPTAATVVARGETLTVSWTTASPTGPGSTATVLASQDGGTTWKPLAVEVTGTTTDIVVPRDMVDATTVVRVIVQDGMVAGRADSEPFEVNAPISVVDEKIVAVRHDLVDLTAAGSTLPAQPGKGLYTMNVDGTNFTEIVPMVPPTNGVGGMVPLHPDWRGDAAAIAFDGEVSGRRDLYVVNPDGSGQQQITNSSSRTGDQFVCADWHPDGRHLLSLATTGFGGQAWLQLVKVDTVTGAVEDVGGWGHSNVFFPAWDIACPRWSDDGNEILFSSESRATGSGQDVDIFVIDVATLQSKYAYVVNPGTIESVAHSTWLNFAPGDDDRFLATQRLFSTGYLMVAELRPKTFYFGSGPTTVDMPTPVWSTSSVEPVGQADAKFGSAGFTADGESIWFTSTNLMFPTRTRKLEQYNFSFWYGITTRSVGHLCRMAVGATTATCYLPGGDGQPVEIEDGYVREPDVPLPAPTVGVIQADVHPGFTRLDTAPPIVVEDPATLPGDPDEPPPTDVETPAPEAPPAPGADATAPVAPPTPVARTYAVPAGTTTPIVLRDGSGLPAPAFITGRPTGGTAELVAANPKGGDPDSTGPDAAVLVTPAPGFVGRLTFEVTPPGGAAVTITVDVLAPPSPTAVNDTLTVAAGSRTIIPASALLDNDTAPADTASSALSQRAAALTELELLSVYGFTGGRATLLADGNIELLVTSPAGGSFEYVVGGGGSSGTSTGRVDVLIAAEPSPSSTSPPATPPATTPPPTVPPVTAPPAAGPPVTEPPIAPSPTLPQGGLPATGQDTFELLRPAAALAALGLCLLVFTRRRRTSRTPT